MFREGVQVPKCQNVTGSARVTHNDPSESVWVTEGEVRLSLCLSKRYAIKTYGGLEVKILTLAIVRSK
jgi:hypothetical protein